MHGTMGDPVTQGQFFERMQQSDDRRDEQHRRVRESIDDLRKELSAKLEAHTVDDARQFKALGDGLLVIQTERAGEKAQAVKRATWVGLLSAGLMTGFWKLVDHFSR